METRTLVCVEARVKDYYRDEPLDGLVWVEFRVVGHCTFYCFIASVRGRRDVGVPCDVDKDLEAGRNGDVRRRSRGSAGIV